MRNKIISAEEAAAMIPDGCTLMIGGFMDVGSPDNIIDALVARGAKDLTIITDDAAIRKVNPDGTVLFSGPGTLIEHHCVKKFIGSHIGLNSEAIRQVTEGEMEAELLPMGTLIEMIRAGGSGLGGVLTKTGLGTDYAIGKKIVNIDGQDYIFEKPLHADVAILGGTTADTYGNLTFRNMSKNFNITMAFSADLVIAGVQNIVAAGEMDPNAIHTPYILVDYIVGGDKSPWL